MKTNVKAPAVLNHEGGKSSHISPLEELKRAVMTCLLWENTMYEGGNELANRIAELVTMVPLHEVSALAVKARNEMYLRHTPLFLVSEMSKVKGSGTWVADTLVEVIQRADELTEFLAIYWKMGARKKAGSICLHPKGVLVCALCKPKKEGKHPLSAGIKRGLARAFTKFSAYDLAKYNGDGAIKLRDVMFLTHPIPEKMSAYEVVPPPITTKNYWRSTVRRDIGGQGTTWRQLVDGTLESPDTWEVALSAGKNKKETFERLMQEGKLGGLAVLRNLRKMQEVGVDLDIIRQRLSHGLKKVLPFRLITAARYAPLLEDALEAAMFQGVKDLPQLPGKTALLVDLSGSMSYALSTKEDNSNVFNYAAVAKDGETSRKDVAYGLAILLREKAEQLAVASFTTQVAQVAPRRGFALRDAIAKSLPTGGTHLKAALNELKYLQGWKDADRVIVITDEQSQDGILPAWCPKSYIVNVAGFKNGVGYDSGWQHINGWSERVLDYIQAIEKEGV